MSFDRQLRGNLHRDRASQSLSNRAMSFDEYGRRYIIRTYESQSLSNRAMSFDGRFGTITELIVSIPFEQGDVFRPTWLRLDSVFTPCLNPFRTGRCLSTEFRTALFERNQASQSLSNRAMSFDKMEI